MPAIEIKLIVVIDTTVAESARFDLQSGLLGDLQEEAAGGSLKIALTEVQVEEMRAHVGEQANALASVAKALQAGAGKRRISSSATKDGGARESDGLAIPRLFTHPKVRAALDAITAAGSQIVADFEDFLAKPYLLTIPCGHVTASRILPAYFGGRAPFGPGRKKDEFPDAIALEAIRDFARGQASDVEVHVVSNDDDWHQSLPKSGKLITPHRTVGTVLQYLRDLGQAADQIEDVLSDEPGLLGEDLARDFPGQGFVLEDDWDASFNSVEVTKVDFKSVTLVSLANRRATLEFLSEVLFVAEVDFTNFGTSAWDSEEGDYFYRDVRTVRIHHSADVPGAAVATIDPSTGRIVEVEHVTWGTTVFDVSLGTAVEVEDVSEPDPDDDPVLSEETRDTNLGAIVVLDVPSQSSFERMQASTGAAPTIPPDGSTLLSPGDPAGRATEPEPELEPTVEPKTDDSST